MHEENINDSGIVEALMELKELQDYIGHSTTKYFGKLLANIVGTDTIPFLLMTEHELLTQYGTKVP